MTASLKSVTGKVLNDPVKRMDRLVEHYTQSCTPERTLSTQKFCKDCLRNMDELDSEPTLEGLSKALDTLSPGKTPGKDGIPEVLIMRKRNPHQGYA